VPAVQIDMSNHDEEKKDQGVGGSRVPGGQRRSLFGNEQEQIRYDEIIEVITENNKEAEIEEYIKYKLINTNI
jgi:hypothetical protein